MTVELFSAGSQLENQGPSVLDLALTSRVVRLRAAAYTADGKPRVAVELGLSFLTEIGIPLSDSPLDEDLERDRLRLIRYLDEGRIDTSADVWRTADPYWSGVMDVLAEIILPALLCNNANLAIGLAFKLALMSVEHGCCAASGYGYVHAAGILASRNRDVKRGILLGEKALELSSREKFRRLAIQVGMCFGSLVIPWTRPIRSAKSYIEDAAKAEYASCDIAFGSYSKRNLVSNLLFSGAPLEEVMRVLEDAVDFTRNTRSQLYVDMILAQSMIVSTLRDSCAQSFKARGLDADWNEGLLQGMASTSMGAFSFWVHRLQICVLFRDWECALESEKKATELLGASATHIETADLLFYGALCRAMAYSITKDEKLQKSHMSALQNHCAHLQALAETCHHNFADRAALAAAELARVHGRERDAQSLYELAIRLAREQNFVQVEAIALETAANFYASLNLPTISETLLSDARCAYLHWGANGKAQEVEARMTRVVGRQHSRKGLGSESVHPDTRAILTASRALSSETALPRLLQVLAWNVLKYAGAQRCAVVLHQDGKFRVEAEVRTSWDGVDGVIESRNMTEADIPLGIFMTVTRTRRRVLLDDAFWTGTFSRDPDVIRRRLRSVLCMPLLKQSELVGILYIENNLLSGAFTDEKSSVLEVFALQAAALLENATRHAGSAESNAQRETVEQELRDSKDELARVASLATMGQLVASIAHEVYQPLASIATSAATALSAVRRDGPNHLKIEEELERIQSESACVRDVVQRLRGLVKRSAPSFCAFDLHAAIQEVLLVTQSQFNRLSVRVVADEIATPRYVWGDKVQIQQVVLNLVVSGVEAMHDIIDHERCLTIKSVVAKGKVKLSVEDTGAGIMGELSDDTSEPFAATNHTGIGARLIICRSIVQAHAGRLTAERLTPHGTRFELTLFEPGRQTDLSPPGPITRFNNVF